MMLFLFVAGLALVALAFVVSARMTRETPFLQRLGAALAGATGFLSLVASTVRPDLMGPSVAAMVACAGWFALAPPRELVESRGEQPQEDL